MEYLSYLVAFFLLGFCFTQKTYKRGCECEYMVDGKCAYTLMLPANGGDNQMSTCPNTDTDQWSKDFTMVREHLQWVDNNITNIQNVNNQQSQSLNVLQSAVLAQTILVQNLTARIDSLPECKNCESESLRSCDECNAVRVLVQEQYIPIKTLQDEMSIVRARLVALEKSTTVLTDRSEDILKVIDTQFPAAQRRVESLEAELNTMKLQVERLSSEMACKRRGLVVSGEDVAITDEFITASSIDNSNTGAVRARIHTQKDGDLAGAWCSDIGCSDVMSQCPYWAEDGECEKNPTYMNKYCRESCKVPCAEPNQDEWLMFDLGTPKTIFGVLTRGRQDYAQWVTLYKVQYTNQMAGNETVWTSFTDPIGAEQNFAGNNDQSSLQTNMLWQPFTAQYVKIIPLAANGNNRCMRADLIGCVDS